MKTCKKCHVSKLVEEFHKNHKMRDGHLSVCKSCINERNKTRVRKNRNLNDYFYLRNASKELAEDIRELAADGLTQRNISYYLSVTPGTVRNVLYPGISGVYEKRWREKNKEKYKIINKMAYLRWKARVKEMREYQKQEKERQVIERARQLGLM